MKAHSLLLLLLCGATGSVRAADASIYALLKTRAYAQSLPAPPAPPATGGFTFAALISTTGPGT